MKWGLIGLLVVGFGACHGAEGASSPSLKAVDSAAAAAPDTIKALPMDSIEGGWKDSGERGGGGKGADSGRRAESNRRGSMK